jgi:hypothetical protein
MTMASRSWTRTPLGNLRSCSLVAPSAAAPSSRSKAARAASSRARSSEIPAPGAEISDPSIGVGPLDADDGRGDAVGAASLSPAP